MLGSGFFVAGQEASKSVTSPYVKTVEELFTHIAAKYSRYASSIELTPDHDHVSVELTFPKQVGLPFSIDANLQVDELQIGVNDTLAGEWFPVGIPDRIHNFSEAFCCLVDGSGRLIQYTRYGKVLKTQVQRRTEGRWEPLATAISGIYVPLLPFKKTILQADPYQ